MTTKGDHMGNGNNNASRPPSSAALEASSDLEPAITIKFGGQEAVVIVAGYTKLAFSVFARGYLLVLLGLPSSSLSTSAGNDKDTADLGVER